jgi:hypothetical protein
MAAEQLEFKFPDDADGLSGKAEFDIEVVDDTPEEDKGRTPLEPEKVKKLEVDETADLDLDALGEHADKVKRKLNQMKKVWHDERRAKETAERERQEALTFAQLQLKQVEKLKSRFGDTEKELKTAREAEIENARNKLKAAYESGDAGEIALAQEALTDAKLRVRDFDREKSLQVETDTVERVQQPERRPVVDAKADAWRKRNSWFGSDQEMTAAALGLHQKLVQSNTDPNYATSDEYYRVIDQTMRRRFPEHFPENETRVETNDTPVRKKPATVVAPATRSSAPQKVRLTASQVALAKRLGLSNEQYAKELIKLRENDNG